MAEAKEVVKVKMQDGREVEFAGKRRMLKSVIARDAAGNVGLFEDVKEPVAVGVRFDFRNGVTLDSFIPQHHILYSAGHGWGQKLGDNVAGLKNDDGSAASEDDMYLEVEGLHERLSADGSSWNEVREGGGFGGASVLMKALIEWSGQTAEQVKEFLSKKSQAEKLTLRDSTSKTGKTGLTIKQIVDRLEAEKKAAAKGKVNEAELLAGLPTA